LVGVVTPPPEIFSRGHGRSTFGDNLDLALIEILKIKRDGFITAKNRTSSRDV
jgi:hypothetical protein